MTPAEQKANPYLLLGTVLESGTLESGTVDVVGSAGEASLLGVYSLEGS